MGLPTLLRNILGFPHPEAISPRGTPVTTSPNYLSIALTNLRQPRVNLYGPAGLRTFLRTTLSLTRTKTAERYAVHELLTPTNARTSCDVEALYDNEEPGQDVLCDAGGIWRDFAQGMSTRGSVNVCAGPLVHRGAFVPPAIPTPR